MLQKKQGRKDRADETSLNRKERTIDSERQCLKQQLAASYISEAFWKSLLSLSKTLVERIRFKVRTI